MHFTGVYKRIIAVFNRLTVFSKIGKLSLRKSAAALKEFAAINQIYKKYI